MGHRDELLGGSRLLTYAVLSVFLIVFAFPLYAFLITSFKHNVDIWVRPLKWLFSPTLDNYHEVLRNVPRPLMNSLIVVVSSMAIAFALGLPCAYSLSFMSPKRKNNIAYWFFSQFILPPMVIVVPFYIFASQLGIRGSRVAVILAYVTFDLPLAVWMMKEFFEGLPRELDDAARVDGCSRLQAFARIALPLARPGIGVTATVCFMFSWNEYMYAAILSNDRTMTLPLLFGLYYRQYEVSWGNIAAMGVLTALPVIVFGIVMQKNLARGLTLGAVKS